jgi:hypothetical protein
MRARPGGAKVLGSFLRCAGAVLVLGIVAATLGSAQAGTSTKFFDASVHLTNPSTPSVCSGTCFTLTLGNDAKSSQTLGSANFTAPPGWTVSSGSTQRVTSGTRSWNVITDGSGLVEFRALSSKDALPPGQSVSADVATAIQCGSSAHPALWKTEVKQSNDFSGQPGNDFQSAATDLTPLGSFSIPTIGTQTTTQAFAVTVTADDTCGIPKTDYSGATATLAHTLLTGATFAPTSGLTWSGGVGAVTSTPALTEVGNTLTVGDTTTGVANPSNGFNVVDKLCPSGPCQAKDALTNPQTIVDSSVPSGGSLGLGFNNTSVQFSCSNVTTQVGSLANIDPLSGYSGQFTVTLTYSKSVSGSRPASSFLVCISDTMGTAWQPLLACATVPVAPCVLSKKRTNFGDLQVVLYLDPTDPWIGTG